MGQKPSDNTARDLASVLAEQHAALKNKYRPEYTQRVKSSVNLFDMMFKNEEQRVKKIEDMTNKLLDRDIAKGVLQAREQAELDARAREARIEQKIAEEKPLLAPGNFDFMEWDPHNQEEMPWQHAPMHDIQLQIPNVPVLQTISDEEFLKYVMNRMQSYNIGTAAYSGSISGKYLLILENKFEAVSQFIDQAKPDGSMEQIEVQNIVRNPSSKKVMYLNYSDNETQYIHAAAQAVQSFNVYGKISLRTRENYILEEIEEIIRTSGYPPTQQYAQHCQQVRNHIAMQMKTFGDLREAWYQPATQTAPPVVNVKVGYNINLNNKPSGAKDTTTPSPEPAAAETPRTAKASPQKTRKPKTP